MGVPTHYVRLLADRPSIASTTATMRLFVSGSAPLLPRTHDAFAERTGHRILERYGATETMVMTSNPLDGDRRPDRSGSRCRAWLCASPSGQRPLDAAEAAR